jgi:hypothetical protein
MYLIASLDPEWYCQIANFVEENPEFCVLLPYASLTRYLVGFNKNPGEEYNPYAPCNIFETVCYGICNAGVNYKYGMTQFKQLVSYLRTVELTKNMEFPFKVQPKKLQIYKDLINTLLEQNINPLNVTLEFVKNTKIKGIGVTTISLCEQLYGEETENLPYTDRGFITGFSKLYGIDKPTKRQILEITQKWKNKKVGSMFMFQCFQYT